MWRRAFGNSATRSRILNNHFEIVVSQQIKEWYLLFPSFYWLLPGYYYIAENRDEAAVGGGMPWIAVFAKLPSHWSFCSSLWFARSQFAPEYLPRLFSCRRGLFWGGLCFGFLTRFFSPHPPLSFSDQSSIFFKNTCRREEPFGKCLWKLNICTCYDLAVLLLGINSMREEYVSQPRDVGWNVHSNIIYSTATWKRQRCPSRESRQIK